MKSTYTSKYVNITILLDRSRVDIVDTHDQHGSLHLQLSQTLSAVLCVYVLIYFITHSLILYEERGKIVFMTGRFSTLYSSTQLKSVHRKYVGPQHCWELDARHY